VWSIKSIFAFDKPWAGFGPAVSTLPRYNLRDVFIKYKEDFAYYLSEERSINTRTGKDYISALQRNLPEIDNPKQLRLHLQKTYTDSYGRALRNLFNFMHFEETDDFNGIPIEKWKSAVKLKPSGVREIYITDKELQEAHQNINEEVKSLLKLLAFSGARLTHTILGIKHFDGVIIKDDLCRISISFASKGNKRAYWIYFPTKFLSEFKELAMPNAHRTYEKKIKYKRVSASTVRKWHLNFLIEKGIPESVVDFIQGRASVTVGSAHYLAKTQQADIWYAKIVPQLLSLFPDETL